MPELPEVETIRRDLEKKIVGKKIVRVQVCHDKAVAHAKTKFIRALEGTHVAALDRRGKLMIAELSKGKDKVLIHLKMTGQLIYVKMSFPRRRESIATGFPIKSGMTVVAGGHKLSEKDIENLPNKFTQVAFVFADGSQLFFNDQRRFGYMKLATPEQVEKALKKYGPEPLSKEFTLKYFEHICSKRGRTNIKALLLNQDLIAGLGNIYVDEVCFCAGVRPTRRVRTLTSAEKKKIFRCIPKILKEAIKHRGTTFKDFLDSSGNKGNYTDFLRVYDRTGEKCGRCGGVIQKTRAAGRGTHFCPKCQK